MGLGNGVQVRGGRRDDRRKSGYKEMRERRKNMRQNDRSKRCRRNVSREKRRTGYKGEGREEEKLKENHLVNKLCEKEKWGNIRENGRNNGHRKNDSRK